MSVIARAADLSVLQCKIPISSEILSAFSNSSASVPTHLISILVWDWKEITQNCLLNLIIAFAESEEEICSNRKSYCRLPSQARKSILKVMEWRLAINKCWIQWNKSVRILNKSVNMRQEMYQFYLRLGWNEIYQDWCKFMNFFWGRIFFL